MPVASMCTCYTSQHLLTMNVYGRLLHCYRITCSSRQCFAASKRCKWHRGNLKAKLGKADFEGVSGQVVVTMSKVGMTHGVRKWLRASMASCSRCFALMVSCAEEVRQAASEGCGGAGEPSIALLRQTPGSASCPAAAAASLPTPRDL